MKNPGTREVIALVLALILWFFVRVTRSGVANESLAQMQMTVPIQLKRVNPNLTAYEVSHDQAVVTVQGESQAVSSLREQQVDAFVDLNEEEATSVWPKVQVIVPGIVKLVSVHPETINVKQSVIASKQVPIKVRVSGPAAKGRSPGAVALSEEEARISGPEPLVNEVAEVRGRVLLTGQSQSSSFELKDLVPVNSEGQPVEARRARLKVVPAVIWATVPIEAESRTVAVAVSLQGIRVSTPPGWRSSIEVEPEFITLRVSRGQTPPEFVSTKDELFQATTKVESRQVPLDIPDGFEVIGSRSVKVRVIPTPISPRSTPRPTPTPTATP